MIKKIFEGVPKNARLYVMLLLAVSVFVLGATGYTILKIIRLQGAGGAEHGEKHEAGHGEKKEGEGEHGEPGTHSLHGPAAESYTYVYKISEITITSSDKIGRKVGYVQFNVVLDCPTAESRRTMELNRAKIRDVIFTEAAAFTIDKLRTIEGELKYRRAILGSLKEAFGELAPRAITIDSWTVS